MTVSVSTGDASANRKQDPDRTSASLERRVTLDAAVFQPRACRQHCLSVLLAGRGGQLHGGVTHLDGLLVPDLLVALLVTSSALQSKRSKGRHAVAEQLQLA